MLLVVKSGKLWTLFPDSSIVLCLFTEELRELMLSYSGINCINYYKKKQ